MKNKILLSLLFLVVFIILISASDKVSAFEFEADGNTYNTNDLELYKYDELIRLMLSKYDFLQVIKITSYIINLYDKHKGIDENNNTIINKYGYYKEALINNLEKLNCDIDLDWDDNYEY